jgi:DNA polymerase theta
VWRLAATETGRLTVDEPNLQTVPKPIVYDLTEYVDGDGSGRGGGGGGGAAGGAAPRPPPLPPTKIPVNVRAAIVAPPGCVLLAADYREMELRLAAHLSGDEGLMAGLAAAGADPLAGLAAAVHGVPPAAVTPAQRAGAKKVAYGLMYGMGDGALAEHLGGVPLQEAAALRTAFLGASPALAAWLAATADAGRDAGCVQTVAGRTRRLHLRTGDGDGGRHHGGHATNTVVQGSAADLAKAAMAALDGALRSGGGGAFPPGAARPVLQLHDELVLEVDLGWVREVGSAVRDAMEGVAGVFGLRVPLPVRVSVGRAWGEMEKVDVVCGV